MYVYVKWNSFWVGLGVDAWMIKACFRFTGHSGAQAVATYGLRGGILSLTRASNPRRVELA